MPATASRAAPTIRADSHACSEWLIAMITQAIRQATPYRATAPPPPSMPTPLPACLALPVISSWASFSSSRTRTETCSVTSFTSSPVECSGAAAWPVAFS